MWKSVWQPVLATLAGVAALLAAFMVWIDRRMSGFVAKMRGASGNADGLVRDLAEQFRDGTGRLLDREALDPLRADLAALKEDIVGLVQTVEEARLQREAQGRGVTGLPAPLDVVQSPAAPPASAQKPKGFYASAPAAPFLISPYRDAGARVAALQDATEKLFRSVSGPVLPGLRSFFQDEASAARLSTPKTSDENSNFLLVFDGADPAQALVLPSSDHVAVYLGVGIGGSETVYEIGNNESYDVKTIIGKVLRAAVVRRTAGGTFVVEVTGTLMPRRSEP